jgi:hypothetical protein
LPRPRGTGFFAVVEPEWISFSDAMAETVVCRRHLLLGNGFSMSKHALFGYTSLYEEALRHDGGLAPLFQGHGASFEAALGAAASADDRIRIRKALVAAIGALHPVRKFLSAEDCDNCGRFLEQFAGVAREPFRGRVFTTNYDLLLYWVLMQRQTRLKLYDGFDNSGIWHDGLIGTTFVFYLHGALHHYEEDIGRLRPEMRQYKLMWREGENLPTQVRRHIATGHLPVFVSEGSSPEKRQSIRDNPYLKRVTKAFTKHCAKADGAVFTFGHSLSEVDEHITDTLGAGGAALYLGVHKPTSDGARAIKLANDWATTRVEDGRPPLRVKLFDTSECRVWASADPPRDGT